MTEMKQTRKIEVKPDLKVNLTSMNFPVYIRSRQEQTVELRIEMEYSQTAETEIKFEDIVELDYLKSENVLNIEIRDPEKLRNYKGRIDLEIPQVSAVKARSENGLIRADDLQGRQQFQTENGSIKLVKMKGELNCLTENGSVVLDACSGVIIVKSENGALKAAECDGRLGLKTHNGAIKLKRCAGSLEADSDNGVIRIFEARFDKTIVKSDNGSIFYEFQPLDKGQFEFKNNNGRIQLTIPENLEYGIKARNKLGSFRINLPGDYERRQTDDKHILELIKGSGSVKIDVQNEFGSINLLNLAGKSLDFDADKIGDIFDSVLESIPDDIEIDTQRIKAKLEKAKDKLHKIKLPDPHQIQVQIDKVMNEVNKEIGKIKTDIDQDDLKNKANEMVSTVMNSLKNKFSREELSDDEREETNRRSRLKILQLLENGRITADEAEKLLKALEE